MKEKKLKQFYHFIKIQILSLWFSVIVLGFLFLYFSYHYTQDQVNEKNMVLNQLFRDRIHLIQDHISESTDSTRGHLFRIRLEMSLKGVVKKVSKKWMEGVDLSKSSLFGKIKKLKEKEIFIIDYPDLFSYNSANIYFVVRKKRNYLIGFFEPKRFFNLPIWNANLLVLNEKNICIMSNDKNRLGEKLKLSRLKIKNGRIYYRHYFYLRQTKAMKILIIQDITTRAYIIVLTAFFLLSVLLFWIPRTYKSSKDFFLLQRELKSLTKITEELSREISEPSHELVQKGDVFYRYYYKILKTKMQFQENRDYLSVMSSLIESIIQILKKYELYSQEILQSKENLQGAKNYLNNLINSLDSAIIGFDSEENISTYNSRAKEFFRDVKIDIEKGKYVNDILESVIPDTESFLKALNRDGYALLQRQRKVAGEKKIIYDIYAFCIEKGKNSGYVLRIDDVSKNVAMEEAMVQSEKMLSVGGMAAGMAHEINNPLGIILQSLQNIKRRFKADLPGNIKTAEEIDFSLDKLSEYLKIKKIDGYFDYIKDAGERAAKIVKSMLLFTRLSENQKKKEQLIHNILENSLDLASNDFSLQKNYDFKKVEIKYDYQDELPKISCYGTELEQVFLNLFKNATQALYEAGTAKPSITIKTRLVMDNIIVNVISTERNSICYSRASS